LTTKKQNICGGCQCTIKMYYIKEGLTHEPS
jgi:hypothetical protein